MAGSNDRNHAYGQWRYLPSPANQGSMSTQPIVHPQPTRPVLYPLNHMVHQTNRDQMPNFPLMGAENANQRTTPPDQPLSYASLYGQAPSTSGPNPNPQPLYQANDPIPEGMRLTAPPYMVTSPRSAHRVLVPANVPPSYPGATVSHLPQTQPGYQSHYYHHQDQVNPYIGTQYLGGNRYPVGSPTPVHVMTPRGGSGPNRSKPFPSFSNTGFTPTPTVMQRDQTKVIFEELEAHTGKCEVCDTRSAKGMSRCNECSWQTCYPCILRNGRHRAHVFQGRTHYGYIDEEKLMSKEPIKGGKRREVLKDTKDSDTPIETPTRARSSIAKHCTNVSTVEPDSQTTQDDPQMDSASETESVLDGARGLYALCVEAYSLLAREERIRGGQEVEFDDNATEVMSDSERGLSSRLSNTSGDMHGFAMEQARIALDCFRNRNSKAKKTVGDDSAQGDARLHSQRKWQVLANNPFDSDGEATEPFTDTDNISPAKKSKPQRNESARANTAAYRLKGHNKRGIVKASRAQSYGRRRAGK